MFDFKNSKTEFVLVILVNALIIYLFFKFIF